MGAAAGLAACNNVGLPSPGRRGRGRGWGLPNAPATCAADALRTGDRMETRFTSRKRSLPPCVSVSVHSPSARGVAMAGTGRVTSSFRFVPGGTVSVWVPFAAGLPATVRVQARVVGAVLMRERHTRYGRENVGYLWMFLEPLMLASVIGLLHYETGHTAYGTDMKPLPFGVIGYTTFILFRGIVKSVRRLQSTS